MSITSRIKWASTGLLAYAALALIVEPALAQSRVGPSFSCATAGNQPLAQIICLDDTLARLDLSYVMVYQALLNQTDEPARRGLAAGASAFVLRTTEKCGLPKSGFLGRAPTPQEVTCIGQSYEQERTLLQSRLLGLAAEEAALRPEDASAVQAALQAKGLLPLSPPPDGVFGPATRAAIRAWQRAAGLPDTAGFVSRALLAQLAGERASPRELLPGAAAAMPATSGSSVLPSRPTATPDFGSCDQLDRLTYLVESSRDFTTGTPAIVGIPPQNWSNAVVDDVVAWARRCIAARVREPNARFRYPDGAEMDRGLNDFARLARQALANRDGRNYRTKEFDLAFVAEAALPNGASVSCKALAGRHNWQVELDEPLFGRSLRDYSDDDFRALVAKHKECEQTLTRLLTSDRSAPEMSFSMLEQLYDWRRRKLEEEQRTAEARQKAEELEEEKRHNPTKLPACDDRQAIRILTELLSERITVQSVVVDAQPRPRGSGVRADVYVPADGLYRREGMEWRECLAFVPYEYQGAARREEVLYRITWEFRAKGIFKVEPATLLLWNIGKPARIVP